MASNSGTDEVHPPELGEPYQQARKSYGLFAALLLAWELVGIELPPAPFDAVNVILKSPDAAPYILLALTIYFALRFTIEWYQAPSVRRSILPTRIDAYVAHSIGLASVSVFAFQSLSGRQFFELLMQNPSWTYGASAALAAGFQWNAGAVLTKRKHRLIGYAAMVGDIEATNLINVLSRILKLVDIVTMGFAIAWIILIITELWGVGSGELSVNATLISGFWFVLYAIASRYSRGSIRTLRAELQHAGQQGLGF